MNDTRLPEDYQPSQSWEWSYTKLKDWDNKIRILTSPIIWFEYFKADNKPKRSKTMFKDTPDIKEWWKVKEFRAFAIYNYDVEQVQLMEITQNSIKNQIREYSKDEDYWNPKWYDIKINKTGKDLETKYQVKPLPPKPFTNEEAIKEAKAINLEALFEWDDPFKPF